MAAMEHTLSQGSSSAHLMLQAPARFPHKENPDPNP